MVLSKFLRDGKKLEKGHTANIQNRSQHWLLFSSSYSVQFRHAFLKDHSLKWSRILYVHIFVAFTYGHVTTALSVLSGVPPQMLIDR